MINKNFTFAALLLALVLGTATEGSRAQSIKEFARIDSLKVGDTFNYSITLDRKKEFDKIVFPDSSQFGSTFEIRSRRQFKVSQYKDSVFYQLQFFATSDTIIPRLPVYLIQGLDTTTLYTKPVPVHFSSVLAEQDSTFRPLKPIFDFAAAWWPYILAALLLLLFAYYLYRYFTREEEQEPEPRPEFAPTPFVNPLQEFKKSIHQLEQMEPETPQEFKQFYIELGDAIRRYFESLYNIPALESTSRELMNMLGAGSVDQDLIKDTGAVLQEADMVKFAKFTPTRDQAERALRKAYNFYERAQKVDGPRVDHMRRKHHAGVEAERERFYKEQEEKQEVNS